MTRHAYAVYERKNYVTDETTLEVVAVEIKKVTAKTVFIADRHLAFGCAATLMPGHVRYSAEDAVRAYLDRAREKHAAAKRTLTAATELARSLGVR